MKNKKIPMAGPWWTEKEVECVKDALLNGAHSYEYVEKFEKEFAKWHDREYALMTPNCTQAIHLLLKALEIKKDSQVIVPETTWIGTSAGIDYCGAKAIFCDVDEKNWCLSPESVKKAINEKTKAIIFVDIFGNMPDMEELMKISKEHNIPLIEDSAEALGSKYKGVRAGKFGIGSVFSFHRTKTIAIGEGGILLLDDKNLYEKCKFLRDHGRSMTVPYQLDEVSVKYMPSNPQAAIAYAQFKRINELVNKKRKILSWYKKHLADIQDLQLNEESQNVENGAWATSLVFGKSHNMTQQKAMENLKELGIPSRPFFQPLSSQPCYEKKGYDKYQHQMKNPVAYDIASRGITLPSSYEMEEEDVTEICSGIKKILEN